MTTIIVHHRGHGVNGSTSASQAAGRSSNLLARSLDISDIANANLTEVAYFDIYPSSNSPNFDSAWSNYPYFASGIEQGLFILQPKFKIMILTGIAMAQVSFSSVMVSPNQLLRPALALFCMWVIWMAAVFLPHGIAGTRL